MANLQDIYGNLNDLLRFPSMDTPTQASWAQPMQFNTNLMNGAFTPQQAFYGALQGPNNTLSLTQPMPYQNPALGSWAQGLNGQGFSPDMANLEQFGNLQYPTNLQGVATPPPAAGTGTGFWDKLLGNSSAKDIAGGLSGLATSIGNIYFGGQQVKMAKQQMNMLNDQWNTQWNAQRKLANNQMADAYEARVQAQGKVSRETSPSTEEYMKKRGI